MYRKITKSCSYCGKAFELKLQVGNVQHCSAKCAELEAASFVERMKRESNKEFSKKSRSYS